MPRPLLPANEGINLIMKNKTILITGGTTGIGLATAKLLSAEGAKIIVTGRNPETLAAVQRELPGVIVIKSDSGSLSAAQSLGGEVKKHVNHLDGVFLNAGIATITPFESESPQHFDDGFNINVRGPFFQLQTLFTYPSFVALCPARRERGIECRASDDEVGDDHRHRVDRDPIHHPEQRGPCLDSPECQRSAEEIGACEHGRGEPSDDGEAHPVPTSEYCRRVT